jgi:hypothetical protein
MNQVASTTPPAEPTQPAAHGEAPGSTARTATGVAVMTMLTIAVTLAVLLLAGAGYLWWAESTYDGGSLGVGYFLAVVAAVPATVSLLLAAPAFALRHRDPIAAAVIATLALAALALPLVPGFLFLL